MKFRLLCLNLFTKYRISNHLWKSGSLTFHSYNSNSLVLRHFRQRVALTVCNTLCFHTTVILKAKSFQEKENEYAHSVMENIQSYSESLVKTPLKAESISPSCLSSELVKEFAQDTSFAEEKSKVDANTEHLIFVYGTLKKNEPNHDVIEKPSEGKATFLGLGQTVQKWPLVIASRYNIPYLLHCEGKGKHVIGELYKVDDQMLANMDKLECHPKYYTRVMTEVQPLQEDSICSASPSLKPWIYFLMNYREHLLELPSIENYSSKDSNGLEYIASEETSDPEDIYK